MRSQSPSKSAGKDRWTFIVLTYSRIFVKKRGPKFWKNQCLNLVVNLDRKDIKGSFCSRTFLLKLLITLNGMMRDAYVRRPWDDAPSKRMIAMLVQCNDKMFYAPLKWCLWPDAIATMLTQFCIHYDATMMMLLTDACMRCICMMHIWISWYAHSLMRIPYPFSRD